jgi:hypothetical protein
MQRAEAAGATQKPVIRRIRSLAAIAASREYSWMVHSPSRSTDFVRIFRRQGFRQRHHGSHSRLLYQNFCGFTQADAFCTPTRP